MCKHYQSGYNGGGGCGRGPSICNSCKLQNNCPCLHCDKKLVCTPCCKDVETKITK